LRIYLDPVATGETATLATADGEFTGADHWITIEPVH
jgi:hypothetical protein